MVGTAAGIRDVCRICTCKHQCALTARQLPTAPATAVAQGKPYKAKPTSAVNKRSQQVLRTTETNTGNQLNRNA